MRALINRLRRDGRVPAGWFARAVIPVYEIHLAVQFSEEERFHIRNAGLGRYVFLRAPIPPDIVDPKKIERMKAEDYGLFFIRDLLRFTKPAFIGAWPDLIAADEAETAIRIKLTELAEQIARAGGTTEGSVVFEP